MKRYSPGEVGSLVAGYDRFLHSNYEVVEDAYSKSGDCPAAQEIRRLVDTREILTVSDSELVRLFDELHVNAGLRIQMGDKLIGMRKFLEAIDICPKFVLDIGCGLGDWLFFLVIRGVAKAGWGINASPGELFASHQVASALGLGRSVGMTHWWGNDLSPLKEGLAELILMVDYLHMTLDWEESILQAAKALAHGGRMFISHMFPICRNVDPTGVLSVLRECGFGVTELEPFIREGLGKYYFWCTKE